MESVEQKPTISHTTISDLIIQALHEDAEGLLRLETHLSNYCLHKQQESFEQILVSYLEKDLLFRRICLSILGEQTHLIIDAIAMYITPQFIYTQPKLFDASPSLPIEI